MFTGCFLAEGPSISWNPLSLTTNQISCISPYQRLTLEQVSLNVCPYTRAAGGGILGGSLLT